MLRLAIIIPTFIIAAILSDIYIVLKYLRTKGLFRKLFILKSVIAHIVIATVCLELGFKNMLLSHSATIWMLMLYIAIYMPQIIFLGLSFVDFRRKYTKYALLPAILLFFTILYGVTYGRMVPKIETTNINIERLPHLFKGYKIVHLSDIHLGNFSDGSYIIKNIVNKINEQDADMVVFTGDLVNLKASELEPFLDILSRVKAKDGVYSVLGNHDYGDYVKWDSKKQKQDNLHYLKDLQKNMGWNLLNNEHHVIRRGDDSIVVAGVENWGLPPFSTHGDLNKATSGLGAESFKVLLSHNPTHWDAEVLHRDDIDLMLAGHTHAMQMKLSLFGFRYSLVSRIYRQWSGLYRKNNQYLYVNEGVGHVGLPMRIGTNPEITVIILDNVL